MADADQTDFDRLVGNARVEFHTLMVQCVLDAAEPRHLAKLGDPGAIATVCDALHEWLAEARQGGSCADAPIPPDRSADADRLADGTLTARAIALAYSGSGAGPVTGKIPQNGPAPPRPTLSRKSR